MNKIKGVNLGGWFVLESWMKPELFLGVDSKDETGFVLKHPHPEQALVTHWHTFITKEDFVYLKRLGMTSIRLPIPWWLEGDTPYVSSIPYIHQAMKWAAEVGLDVLLDLHTAPGCQNGFDNGGIEGVLTWHLSQKNIDLTIDRLESIVLMFKDYPSFFGIEVLNEPHSSIDMKIIQRFYATAYHRLRKHTDKWIVFHDAFRPNDPSWSSFFQTHKMKQIAFDLHLYHCFDQKLAEGSMDDHIGVLMNQRLPMIKTISSFVPVIIGEWSLAIRHQPSTTYDPYQQRLITRLLADLQLYVYSHAYGFYFWSYKIERDSHLHWDFRRLVKEGILPSSY